MSDAGGSASRSVSDVLNQLISATVPSASSLSPNPRCGDEELVPGSLTSHSKMEASVTEQYRLLKKRWPQLKNEHLIEKIIPTLLDIIDKRDCLTAQHSLRVTEYSLLIGQNLGLGTDDLTTLHYAALLHDYGKMGIPDSILCKADSLTPREFTTVKSHSRLTFDLLSGLPFAGKFSDVPFVASCHHEKFDGGGYPRGLKGIEIPFLARIIAVADVFDAITSVRHYRDRMPIVEVFDTINRQRSSHFDPLPVDVLVCLPLNRILQVMDPAPANITLPLSFQDITFSRLIELCKGSTAASNEQSVPQLFQKLYSGRTPSLPQAA